EVVVAGGVQWIDAGAGHSVRGDGGPGIAGPRGHYGDVVGAYGNNRVCALRALSSCGSNEGAVGSGIGGEVGGQVHGIGRAAVALRPTVAGGELSAVSRTVGRSRSAAYAAGVGDRQAEVAPDDQGWVDGVGKAHARLPVLVVRMHRGGAVAHIRRVHRQLLGRRLRRVGGAGEIIDVGEAGKLHHSRDAHDGIHRGGVDPRDAV